MKKFSRGTVFVIVALIVIVGITATAALLDQDSAVEAAPQDNFVLSEDGYFVIIDGQRYAMNPTELPTLHEPALNVAYGMNPTMIPLTIDEAPDVRYGMNPTMIPLHVDEAPDIRYGMNPTMIPLTVDEALDVRYGMNPTMLPEEYLNGFEAQG